MINPSIRKLEAFGRLPDEDRQALEQSLESTRQVGADRDLVREGDRPAACQLIVQGFACRHRTMPDGRRQIMSFEIAGDLCDLHGFLLGEADHSVTTLTPCTVASIPHGTLTEWIAGRPAIARALWLASLVDAAISREWIVNVGRRTAYGRAAHLLCEVVQRLHLAGLANGYACELPLNQLVLADALALACEDGPDVLVSMATLTGAARVAVGPDLAPYYTDDAGLAAALEGGAWLIRISS